MFSTHTLVLVILGLFPNILGQAEVCTGVSSSHRALMFESDASMSKPIVSVPFTFDKGVPIIKVDVNGNKDEYFLIDSGSARTLLNADEALRLKVSLSNPNLGPLPGSGDSKGQAMLAAKSVALKLDNTLISKGDVPAVSLSQLSKDLDLRITGIVGYDILRAHPTAIDYVHRRFSIYRAKGFTLSSSEQITEFSVESDSTLPIISSEIGVAEQNLGATRVLIDTGFQRAVMISPGFAAKYQLEKLDGWKHDHGSGIGGEFAYIYGLSGWITCGEHKLSVPNMSVSQAQDGTFTKGNFDAIIGGSILGEYEIIFDLTGGKVVFLRAGGPALTQ